jgi:histidinol-phosphate/aromatic aminotransferase/cobyric acid decarboxylase-like protein
MKIYVRAAKPAFLCTRMSSRWVTGKPVLRILMLWLHAIYRRRLILALLKQYGLRNKGKVRYMEKSRLEKGGFPLEGINLALCENPLPPIEEAIEAAKAEAYLSNHYTEPYSWKLKGKISDYINVPVENIHTETYFFLGKIPRMDADEFAKALRERNINVRPLHHERLENKFLRFATSTPENNMIVLEAIRNILM